MGALKESVLGVVGGRKEEEEEKGEKGERH